jgi:hypothetical protein
MTAGQFSLSSPEGRGTTVQIAWRLSADEPKTDVNP